MLNIRDLRIDPASLGTKKLLVDVAPAYEYKDGKRTDTVTGYTTVYITSNISLDEQYTEVQRSELETWRAFLRRIGCVKEFRKGKPPREVPFHDKRR